MSLTDVGVDELQCSAFTIVFSRQAYTADAQKWALGYFQSKRSFYYKIIIKKFPFTRNMNINTCKNGERK